jgi:hypothetical protein
VCGADAEVSSPSFDLDALFGVRLLPRMLAPDVVE